MASVEISDGKSVRRIVEVKCEPSIGDEIVWHPESIAIPLGTRSVTFQVSSLSNDFGDWIAFAYPVLTDATIVGKTNPPPIANVKSALGGGPAFSASPNPIAVSAGETVGATTIRRSDAPADKVQVHIGSPSGPLFAEGGPAGESATRSWVTDGLRFFLVDAMAAASGSPVVLGKLSVHLCAVDDRSERAKTSMSSCGQNGRDTSRQGRVGNGTDSEATLSADENPVQVGPDDSFGSTRISWHTAPGTSTEIRVGSPTGAIFAKGGGEGSSVTGNWVANGTKFYLEAVDVKSPKPRLHELARLTVAVCRRRSDSVSSDVAAAPSTPPLCE